MLQHSRLVLQWLQYFQSLLEKSDEIRSYHGIDFHPLESYIWTFISCSQSSVKHNVRNALALLLAVLQKMNPDQLTILIAKIENFSWSSKDKYLAMLAIVKTLGLEKIKTANLPTCILTEMADPTVSSSCLDLYECCSTTSHQSGLSKKVWMETWVKPLLPHDSTEARLLLSKAMKLCPEVADFLFDPAHDREGSNVQNQLLAIKFKKRNRSDWKDYLQCKAFIRASKSYSDSVSCHSFHKFQKVLEIPFLGQKWGSWLLIHLKKLHWGVFKSRDGCDYGLDQGEPDNWRLCRSSIIYGTLQEGSSVLTWLMNDCTTPSFHLDLAQDEGECLTQQKECQWHGCRVW